MRRRRPPRPTPEHERDAALAGEAGAGARRTLSRRGALAAAGVAGASVAGAVIATRSARQPAAPAPTVPPRVPQFPPRLFSPEQALLVEELAESIIPETDSPGALRAGVPAYIEGSVCDVYDEAMRVAFLEAMDALNREAREGHGQPFFACTPEVRAALVAPLLARAALVLAEDHPRGGAPFCFFAAFRELCIEGFCQSRFGATRVLQYESVPGAYQGCVPLESVGRAWATS